jgi:hypothetical protein
MRYLSLLILIIIIFQGLDTAFAEDSRYRVEIIVLTHLGHDQEGREVRKLNDFSSAMDFLQPPPEDTEDIEAAAAPAEVAPLSDETSDASTDEALLPVIEEDPWSVVTHVEQMGPEMQEAWRRLRLSAPFRPLQYLAWEQGSNPPFPLLRVHDLEAVLVEDPWADERLLREAAEGSAVFGDTAASSEQPGFENDEEEALPDPIAYYRLDGTVSLTRSRFLHLAMAVEWREPLFDEAVANAPTPLPSIPGEPPPQPLPSSFLIHRLEQSRPVRTGRMEYFDGPVLGVLAWVSDISDTVVVEPAE